MSLWLLRRVGRTDWDENAGFVIRAPDELRARAMAAKQAAEEGRATWLVDDRSTCVLLSSDGPAEIIIQDFVRG